MTHTKKLKAKGKSKMVKPKITKPKITKPKITKPKITKLKKSNGRAKPKKKVKSHDDDDIKKMILESHKAICKAKNMGEKDAYGHDPGSYYTLALCGEAGEMANAVIKTLRNGTDKKEIKRAVESELPDVIIYAYILAHILDVPLTKLVQEKVKIVIERANNGYYGGPVKVRERRTRRNYPQRT